MNPPLRKHTENLLSITDLSRWKRMTGSSVVVGAAAATSASAGVVQITLPNQIVSNNGPTNTITFDFTGDGINDGAGFFAGPTNGTGAYISNAAGLVATARGTVGPNRVAVGAATAAGNPRSVSGLLPITFTDARINGGVATAGLLEIKASNTNVTGTIQLVRSVFNDNGVGAPGGVVAGGTNKEFDPTVYAMRTKFASKIKKLNKKAKKAARSGDAIKAKKLKKKAKKLAKKLAAIA